MNPFRESRQHIRSLPSAFWVVIAASLTNQIGNMALVFLIIYLTNYVGYTLSQASGAFAAVCISQLLVGLVSGSLINRFGVERVMVLTLSINGIALSLIPYAHQYAHIILLCLIWGFTFGLYKPASATFISFLGKKGQHKITFSIYRLVQNLGMSMGPAIGGYLAHHNFEIVFYANGFANFLAAIILILGIGTKRKVIHYQKFKRSRLKLNWQTIKQDTALWFFIFGMIAINMVYFQHESTLSVFLHNELNFDMRFYGLLFTLNTLIIVFCELPLNIATLNWPYRINFMLGSLLITFAFTTLALAHQEWHIIVSALFWTLGEMMLYPSANSFIAEIAPQHLRATYISLYGTCSNVGILFGPVAGAILMENAGSQILWLMCGVWGMLSVLSFHFIKKPKTADPELALDVSNMN